MPRLPRVRALAVLAWTALSASSAGAADPDADGLAFFERKIRPVLVEHCHACHSAEAEAKGKLKGGLRVDARDDLLQGGDSGPAVVPGDPGESALLVALRYDDLVQMPPKGRLPDAVIADFEAWIRMGAPDPRVAVAGAAPARRGGIDPEQGREHWAYQPPRAAGPPEVADADWPANEVDRFVLAGLEAAGLEAGPEAGRATLLRRLTFDLHGLPPTPGEIAAFEADDAPDAYERAVDRLLASPRFGERWGRHWLDVARFAESLTLRGFILKPAWRYRDSVIDAFNADLPFDQFVREQVAGDLLPAETLEDRRRGRVAVGFLALGNTNLEDQDKRQLEMDVVDEQLDTLGKTFLAQTIGCARCHDHKFDPIPTADYYALAGILKGVQTLEHDNVSKWIEAPLPVEPARAAELERHAAAVAALEARVKVARERSKGSAARGVIAAADLPGIVVDDAKARKVGAWTPSTFSGSYVDTGYLHDADESKGEKTLTFQPDLPAGEYEVRLAYSHGGSRSTAVPVTILHAGGESELAVDMRAAPPVEGRFVALGRFRFENNQGFVLVSNAGTTGHVTADAVQFLPVAEAERLAKTARPGGGDELERLEAELKRLKAGGPEPDLALAVREGPEFGDIRIHVRGSVHTLGPVAPRGFLRVATDGEAPPMPTDASGRRELADWLASRDNPLTARVYVNRAWHWLFAAGLVRTVDNFGTTGEAPSHPELLDWLAVRFMDEGWSTKALVRRLVLSRAYRLAPAEDPAAAAVDPENRLLWRANRRRLDAECLRDAMLAVGGNLDPTMGGPNYPPKLASDYGFEASDTRRSVYTPVFRNALPDLFERFDFADPSRVVGRRDASTVAPQALFLLNHPFVLEQARLSARRLLAEPGLDDAGRADRAYRLTLGRGPTGAERRLALGFVAGEPDPEAAWAAVFQALFASADFRFLD